jgi:predicted nucleotidyltransferase
MNRADKRLLRNLKQALTHLVPDAEMFLYGSRARGNPDPSSDYDLLVLTGSPIPEAIDEQLQDAFYDFELEHQVVLSVVFYPRDQWNAPVTQAMPFRRRLEKEAVAL